MSADPSREVQKKDTRGERLRAQHGGEAYPLPIRARVSSSYQSLSFKYQVSSVRCQVRRTLFFSRP